MVAGVAKRRKQKVYSDVLGRFVKTEVFSWQDGGIDSTTVQTYNVRDQVTQLRQYSGSETSGSFQDTAITYDGFGRLKTKHVPEQAVGTVTTWNYNADDTVQRVTDARGASRTLGYNQRHLPTSIIYAVPTGSTISVPAPVSFTYDAAGNRTKMTDGNGVTDYGYDQLSRLKSEARSFAGLTGTFSIGYDYNLGNQLTTLTEPTQFGSSFSYVHDAVGRLTNVNGSSFDGVTSYASNAQYRAWRALKHMNYGNGKALDATYNSRLQTATFTISGVMSKSYQYYADGALRFSGESTSHTWDRFYSYDHNGRVKEAFSGAEARFEGLTNNRPYRQTFTYDAVGHLTGETSKIWSATFTRSDTFSNNRRNGWSYDADGSLLAGDNTYSYDAGGEVKIVDQNNPSGTMERFLDGDGQQVKTNGSVFNEQTQSWVTTTTYYLRSTVLQGEVLTEIDSTGAKQRTFVFANGSIIAWQRLSGSVQSLIFEHRDAGNASFRTTDAQGFSGTEPDEMPAELDPTGANTVVLPQPEQFQNETLAPYPRFSDPSNPGTTYSIDGIPVPADYFARFVNFAFHGPLGFAEAAARASSRVRGRRITGVSWGTTFEIIYDENGRVVSVRWGKFDPNRRQENFGKETLIYDSWNLNLLPQQPQDTVSDSIHWWDLAKILTHVKAIAARGRCQEFLTNLLERAGEKGGDKAVHTDIVDLFLAVFQQQGFVTQKDVNGRGFSSVGGAVGAPGGAQVRLSNGSNDFKGQLRSEYFAFDALSELTHVAGSKPSHYIEGAFSDYNLAKTAFVVANEMGGIRGNLTLPTVDPYHDRSGAWSDYYHYILGQYCKRQERF
jgi:YD repeat-containing protein